jgi:hypothetical protein
VAEENFLSPLKAHPTALLEGLRLLLVFSVLSLSLSLFLAHLYQMTCQLKNYLQSGSEISTDFLLIASRLYILELAKPLGVSFSMPPFLIQY